MWITSSFQTIKTPTYIALGNFDGIHRGHRRVIEPILQGSSSVSQVQDNKGVAHSTVLTFHPHPREFFTGQRRTLLTPLDEKVRYLQELGVEQLVLLPFNQELANLSPEAFVEEILVKHLQAKRISVGQDFCFGRQRSGTATNLQAIAAQHGVCVEIVPLHTDQGERISSSAIRQALEQGNPQQAKNLLGRPYTLIGQVVQGQQLGRTIGFPTANLKLPPEKFIPCQGVYSVWVRRQIMGTQSQPLPAVMNIGYRPTLDGAEQTIEVHLLDWTGNLYGETLLVSLEEFLRPEQKFVSLEELKAQIAADCDTARAQLTTPQPTF